jgi:hypothetical protein
MRRGRVQKGAKEPTGTFDVTAKKEREVEEVLREQRQREGSGEEGKWENRCAVSLMMSDEPFVSLATVLPGPITHSQDIPNLDRCALFIIQTVGLCGPG